MSGGVDSSVAAALLVEQGYDVIGMMMRLWSEDGGAAACDTHNRCCTPDQMRDARRIADQLGIPFYVLDTQAVFRQQVVQAFIDGYAAGETPNPCLTCNRHIRFTHLLNHALALDADYLATGHYARVRTAADGTVELHKGLDDHKDQSYVLSVLRQDQLRHAMFPVGEFTKPEVRELAARFGLPVASKHDSQDLCFLADGDYRRFLREHAPQAAAPGPIVTRQGTRLGVHTGLPDYTIGQRKGLGISNPEPLYVLGKNPLTNTLVVGTRAELGQDTLTASAVNWISGKAPEGSLQAEVKIRYKAQPARATITPLEGSRARVQFEAPLRDIAPGQGAVFYAGTHCLGGGKIDQRAIEHDSSALPTT
ncbi:MAG: tRNA 2-thiouridine(34) synthase MnmA [Anaerolineae bacterium]|nr:tRNA 2-thiouridine(34) synthase MnmA [Anaerolineae bacterium]